MAVSLMILLLVLSDAQAQSSGDLRLSTTPGSGRLEIFLRGEWGTVCDDRFGQTEADVACRQLGFLSAIEYGSVDILGYPRASFLTEIWLDGLVCGPDNPTLLSCFHNGIGIENCDHSEDVALICRTSGDGNLRLNGDFSDDQAGRLEIFLRGEWGTVCDDGFGQAEANVACRQLGYSSVSKYGDVETLGKWFKINYMTIINPTSFSPANSFTEIWLDEVLCTSIDTTLLSCHHDGIGVHDCGHDEDVAIACSHATASSQSDGAVRLVNSSSTNAQAGRLEIFWHGEWGTVCSNGFGLNDAAVVCRQLGTLTPRKVGSVDKLGFDDALDTSTVIWLDEVSCVGNEKDLLSCGYTYNLFGGGLRDCSNSAPVVAVECRPQSTGGISGYVLVAIIVGAVMLVFMCSLLVLAICSGVKRSHRPRQHQPLISNINM